MIDYPDGLFEKINPHSWVNIIGFMYMYVCYPSQQPNMYNCYSYIHSYIHSFFTFYSKNIIIM